MRAITRLAWYQIHNYELGLDRGVFYPQDGPGVAWSGLTSVKEVPTDSSEQTRYVDGILTNRRRSTSNFAGTIEAFTYPDSFYENVLVQKRAKPFGLSYRIQTANSYKIHLVYNVSISPAGFSYKQSTTDSFSWDFTTKPLPVPEAKLSSHLVIDASQAYSWVVSELEDILYGSDNGLARLPTPDEVVNLFENGSILQVTDNGDGTFTVTGPDSAIQMLDSTTFQIDWPSAVYIDDVSYTIRSL